MPGSRAACSSRDISPMSWPQSRSTPRRLKGPGSGYGFFNRMDALIGSFRGVPTCFRPEWMTAPPPALDAEAAAYEVSRWILPTSMVRPRVNVWDLSAAQARAAGDFGICHLLAVTTTSAAERGGSGRGSCRQSSNFSPVTYGVLTSGTQMSPARSAPLAPTRPRISGRRPPLADGWLKPSQATTWRGNGRSVTNKPAVPAGPWVGFLHSGGCAVRDADPAREAARHHRHGRLDRAQRDERRGPDPSRTWPRLANVAIFAVPIVALLLGAPCSHIGGATFYEQQKTTAASPRYSCWR